MTYTLAGADIRGFYAALGVKLPHSASANVSVRCFAHPDRHRRDDHDPSCSVKLIGGSWKCHGCDAAGGAYDAARELGHTERSAMDLLVKFGLADRDPRPGWRRHASAPRSRQTPRTPAVQDGSRPAFTISDADVQRWQAALNDDQLVVARLIRSRGWQPEMMRMLELGFDDGRITIPVRNGSRQLVGLLRYRPWPHSRTAKMRAAPGSRRQLHPHPECEPRERVLLVEGEPDMIAARSHGLPAIAVPGTAAWKTDWARLLAGRDVRIIMDADDAGRAAAQRIAKDLAPVARTHVVDLAPDRDDGYDLTNWLLEHDRSAAEVFR